MVDLNYELIQLLKDCSAVLNAPVLLIDHNNRIKYHFPDHLKSPPAIVRKYFDQYIDQSRKFLLKLQFFSDPFNQHVFLYPFKTSQGTEMVIGIGPFLHQEIGRSQVQRMLKVNDMDPTLESKMMAYFDQLPVFNRMHMLSIERLLNVILPGTDTNVRAANAMSKKYYKKDHSSKDSIPDQGDEIKRQFISSFKMKDHKALHLYQSYKEEYSNPLADADELRSEKNQLIRMVTELTQICIEEGGPRDELESLCEFYIRYGETKEHIDEIQELENNIILTLMERCGSSRNDTYYSPHVERAQRYILNNLTEELTLKDIAADLNVHPNYLSGIFTKETGISISQFINEQRVNEAKELLSITDYSLMEISILLGYNSQSYFTRVFKKHTGIGPKEFRKKYHVMG
ncbi:AraC family transcriptional regulator [Halobacillus yeomjeoni]|uniref:AraC family transcriptional regulator n=1 Tax=Halobacillus yeomjeoni TaxID=311194 RepID=A0A931HWG7_9BACI|nr:AraC family transcriptional regulator [Halobacillus yeomjeoni]MBH0230694.1 AraC family transcriptional regulator [Halobacillus yeomjeoni]